MKFTAEDEKYLNIENLQKFLNDGGCLFIEYWKDLENGDTSNRDKDEVKILTKGDNIEEILKKDMDYIFSYSYKYKNGKNIISNNKIEIGPLELNNAEKEDIKNHDFDKAYIYDEYYDQRDYDDYENNLILNFQEEFKLMFKIEILWLDNGYLKHIKTWRNYPKKHDEVVYCLYGLLEENNSVNIALLKNDYNKLKENCICALKDLKESYENVLRELNYNCDDFVKRNCKQYKDINEGIQEYINEIDYISKSNLINEAIQYGKSLYEPHHQKF